MNRFPNPHAGMPVVHQQNQQAFPVNTGMPVYGPGGQQFVPNGMGGFVPFVPNAAPPMNMNQGMNPGMMMNNAPQGQNFTMVNINGVQVPAQVMPNGAIVIMPMNQQQQQQPVQPANPGRFTGGPQRETVQFQPQAQSQPTQQGGDTRFQVKPMQNVVSIQNPALEAYEQSFVPVDFTVYSRRHEFNLCPNIIYKVATTPIQEQFYEKLEEGSTATECLQAAVESLFEQVNSKDKDDPLKVVTIGNFIITNTIYRVHKRDELLAMLSSGVKHFYKKLNNLFREAETTYELSLCSAIDLILTDAVNDFIAINTPTSLHISSFVEDFNELLKLLRDLEGDVEGALIAYLDTTLATNKKDIESMSDIENATVFTENYDLVYLDMSSWEIGVEGTVTSGSIYRITGAAVNMLLFQFCKTVMEMTGKSEFVMVTADRRILKFMRDLNEIYYFKRIL